MKETDKEAGRDETSRMNSEVNVLVSSSSLVSILNS